MVRGRPVPYGPHVEATPESLVARSDLAVPLPARISAALRSSRGVSAPIGAGIVVAAAVLLAQRVAIPAPDAVANQAIELVAGLAAIVAILRGAWTAESPLDRRVRSMLAGSAVFYTVAQLVHLAAAIGRIDPPVAFDAVPLAGLMLTVGGCWYLVLRGRLSRAEQVAVVLDSAVVFCTVGAAALVLLGNQATNAQAATTLSYAVVFAAALGATVILNLAITPRRFAGGWLAIVAGIIPVLAGSVMELRSPAHAQGASALVQSLGVFLCAYGAATWSAEPDSSDRFRALASRIRAWLPMAAVGFAPILIVTNELFLSDEGDRLGGLVADGMLALVLMLCVVRQTMLLRDRDQRAGEARAATDREQTLVDDLRRSEQRFRSLVTHSSDVFLIIGADGTVSYQSPAVERVLGYQPDARAGRQIFELTHPDDIGFVKSTIANLLKTPGAQETIELRTRHADGTWRTLEATGRNLMSDPSVGGIVVNYRDVTERKRLEEQLTQQAFHDPLTGLANRALFSDRTDHAMRQRREDRKLAVLFLDLDDFKTVNDSLGHVAGDLVLRAVADRLAACLRTGDTVGRLGGDEFAVLVEDADAADTQMVARRILDAFGDPFEVAGRQVRLSASIGVAFGAGAGSADELMRNADVAMYTAKGRGKGRIELFEASMHTAIVTRLELRGDLEHALERGELRLRYQPVHDLGTGALHSFEALLRWRHPQRGEVPPDDFIPIAEETGLILPIGRWVLEQACRQAQAWRESGNPHIAVSVNLSSRQLQEQELPTWVAETLAATGLPAANLVLELTESSLLQDDAGLLEQLSALGVRRARDDFGPGYSSLSYLARFPMDQLKIDRTFIADVGTPRENTALLRSVIQLASAMKLRTVAEGIERQEQLDRVRELGCDFGQGFLFAQPMDAIRATAFIAEPHALTPGVATEAVAPEPAPARRAGRARRARTRAAG
jgi:diguanylate cyclase (GGDEF)-like protein/PAS domain S-box-containing protein